MARCPAHDDRVPSLAIDERSDGTVLVCCHAGCSQHAVINALTARPRTGSRRMMTVSTSSLRRGSRGHRLGPTTHHRPQPTNCRLPDDDPEQPSGHLVPEGKTRLGSRWRWSGSAARSASRVVDPDGTPGRGCGGGRSPRGPWRLWLYPADAVVYLPPPPPFLASEVKGVAAPPRGGGAGWCPGSR